MLKVISEMAKDSRQRSLTFVAFDLDLWSRVSLRKVLL